MQQFKCKDVKIIKKETGYKGFFTINKYTLQHKMFNGKQTRILQRECFERGHAVGVLAYDPWQDKVILLEQFRIGACVNELENTKNSASNNNASNNNASENSPWLLEIIAGIVEPGESQEQVALREAQEEAGCQMLALEPVGNFLSSPGGTSETTQLYCGCVRSDAMGGIHGLEEEGEDIRVWVVDYTQAVQWLKQGRLNNASVMIALQWLMLNYQQIRDKWLEIGIGQSN